MKKRFLVVSVILSSLSVLPVFAKEEKEIESKSKTEAKFYGYVQIIPKEKTGIWQVKNRKIIVDKKTEIEEKYGKVKVGTYVEVKGLINQKKLYCH